MEAWGELLALECDEAELFVFNACRVVDALDEESSDLVRFRDGGIVKINRHVFKPESIDVVEVFKLPQTLPGAVFVTEAFVERIAESCLRGTDFHQIWES